MTPVEVQEARSVRWSEYARISIAFEVRSVFDVELLEHGLAGISLRERVLSEPWRKDYDQHDGGPSAWPVRFDVSSWRVLFARSEGRTLGGAVLIHGARDVQLLDGRRDLALLWDLRVQPEARGQGVGSALFRGALQWARERGCRQLKVETQSVNVPACRAYAHLGCRLAGVQRFAYPHHPDETQLIWMADL